MKSSTYLYLYKAYYYITGEAAGGLGSLNGEFMTTLSMLLGEFLIEESWFWLGDATQKGQR